MSKSNDGSENVSDFLRRIKNLDNGTDADEAENARKLEEDILEGRKLREARRAERARSISPEKQSPATSLRSYQSPKSPDTSILPSSPQQSKIVSAKTDSLESVLVGSSFEESELKAAGSNDIPQSRPLPVLPSSSVSGAHDHLASNTSIPTRSGTLSWQQRPSTLRGSRSRPLSMVGRQSPTLRVGSQSPRADAADDEPSRDQIAHALGAKDPTWFRQTPDRGIGSPAYRKSPEDHDSPSGQINQRRQLHGLSRESSPASSQLDASVHTIGTSENTNRAPRGASSSHEDALKVSSLPIHEFGTLSAAVERPSTPDEDSLTHTDVTNSSLESNTRPLSPTKGMGGFVQSAMLKRSDSVGKRWSVQSTTGLGRSAARRTANTSGDSSSLTNETQPSTIDSKTIESSELSSRNAATDYQEKASNPPYPIHHRSKSSLSMSSVKDTSDGRPPSPSKRWSPVKSSWLENALNKPPESPKSTRPESMQPSWMVDLNKRRQQFPSQDKDSVSDIALPSQAASLQTSSKSDKVDGKEKFQSNFKFQAPPLVPKPEFSSQGVSDADAADIFGPDKPEGKVTDTTDSKVLPSTDSPSSKPKPETPPKKDFRSSLQIREAPGSGKKAGGDLEFQNVFGKLRRTETKNYVAPDVLKNNILRGKAGLTITGGPQKTARVDEFKESLLKQKEAMKAKAAEVLAPPANLQGPASKGDREAIVPEAIAKKKALSSSSGNVVSRSNTKPIETLAINIGPSAGDMNPLGSTTKPAISQPKPVRENTHSIRLPEQEQAAKATTGVVLSSEKTAKGKLAGRFNPNLANMIAKGPMPKSQSLDDAKETQERVRVNPMQQNLHRSDDVVPSSGGGLQHMTKGRARGPKRRLPKSQPESKSVDSLVVSKVSVTNSDDKNLQAPKPAIRRPSRNVTPSDPSSTVANPVLAPKSNEKPRLPPKSPRLSDQVFLSLSPNMSSEISLKSSGSATDQDQAVAKSQSADSFTIKKQATSSTPRGTERTHIEIDMRQNPTPTPPTDIFPSTPTVIKSPSIPLASKPNLKELSSDQSPRFNTKSSVPSSSPITISNRPLKETKAPPPASSTATLRKGDTRAGDSSVGNAAISTDSLFRSFFNERPIADKRIEFDTQAILDSGKRKGDKVKTLRKQIVEVTGDGKQIPPALNEEHILFSGCMYLCTHIYGDTTGARITEVYLWSGSEVSESAIEDAQIFARRTAKLHGGKLVLLKQNKESENFLQALGGIMILRHGRRINNFRPYMLCGRDHLGHIVFDEVDISLGQLCSGFPFILAPKPEMFYLWKGKGCSAQEIGSARLISMDLGPKSKVVEVEEGKEPAEFLSSFSSGSQLPASAEYWPLKAKHNNYRTRLFRIDDPTASPARPSSSGPTATVNALWSYVRKPSQTDILPLGSSISNVTEICPYSQVDLESEHIYVLDAFFELFVIVGSLTSSKPHVFARSLLFAQDYAIVAASSEDRPFVPPGTVALEGATHDMKAAFRQWHDNYVPTSALMAGAAKARGGKLNIMPLNSAIEAIRSP